MLRIFKLFVQLIFATKCNICSMESRIDDKIIDNIVAFICDPGGWLNDIILHRIYMKIEVELTKKFYRDCMIISAQCY
jgi:hypothetical protein